MAWNYRKRVADSASSGSPACNGHEPKLSFPSLPCSGIMIGSKPLAYRMANHYAIWDEGPVV